MKQHKKYTELEAAAFMAVVMTAVLAVISYAVRFHSLELGGPDSWGSFGDFFGGLLNPVVGVATVLLVLSTLHTTRHIASEQERLLRDQLDVAQLEATLRSIEKRMDGVLADWRRLMTSRRWAAGDIFATIAGAHVSPPNNPTLEELCSAEEWRSCSQGRSSTDGDDVVVGATRQRYFAELPHLVAEMDLYTTEYMRKATDLSAARLVTDYYTRRMQDGIFIISNLGLLDTRIQNRLQPIVDLRYT